MPVVSGDVATFFTLKTLSTRCFFFRCYSWKLCRMGLLALCFHLKMWIFFIAFLVFCSCSQWFFLLRVTCLNRLWNVLRCCRRIEINLATELKIHIKHCFVRKYILKSLLVNSAIFGFKSFFFKILKKQFHYLSLKKHWVI